MMVFFSHVDSMTSTTENSKVMCSFKYDHFVDGVGQCHDDDSVEMCSAIAVTLIMRMVMIV